MNPMCRCNLFLNKQIFNYASLRCLFTNQNNSVYPVTRNTYSSQKNFFHNIKNLSTQRSIVKRNEYILEWLGCLADCITYHQDTRTEGEKQIDELKEDIPIVFIFSLFVVVCDLIIYFMYKLYKEEKLIFNKDIWNVGIMTLFVPFVLISGRIIGTIVLGAGRVGGLIFLPLIAVSQIPLIYANIKININKNESMLRFNEVSKNDKQ